MNSQVQKLTAPHSTFVKRVLPFMTIYLTTRRGLSEAAAGRMIALYGVGAVCAPMLRAYGYPLALSGESK